MSDLTRATTLSNGITLDEDGQNGLFYKDIDPSVSGADLPINSLIFSSSGLFRKIGSGATDWQDTRQYIEELILALEKKLTGVYNSAFQEEIPSNTWVNFLNISGSGGMVRQLIWANIAGKKTVQIRFTIDGGARTTRTVKYNGDGGTIKFVNMALRWNSSIVFDIKTNDKTNQFKVVYHEDLP